MDPNATLAAIARALTTRNYASARDSCAFLYSWLIGGGFEPDWSQHTDAAEFYSAWRRNR